MFKMHSIQEHQELLRKKSWLPNTLGLGSYWSLSQATPPINQTSPAVSWSLFVWCKRIVKEMLHVQYTTP